MAVKGLDIFKLSPKKNCKECGVPTCMAFCMKVAQGALPIEKCPYMSDEAIALLSEATAPPMKALEVGGMKLGGETVIGEGSIIAGSAFVISSVPAGSRVSLKNQEVNVRTPNKDHAKCWEI